MAAQEREIASVERHLVEGAQGVDVFFQPGQERLVADQPVLDDFRQARRQLARWQGIEGRGVDQHSLGLVERAHHVFAQRMVDAGLAAHRRIDLGQQGGRHLDEVHAALVAGGRKTGHVTDHAATQGDHGGAPVMACGQQAIEDQLQGFPVLVGFAVGQHHGDHRVRRQAAAQTLKIQRRDRFVGDDRHLPPGNMRCEQLGLVQQTFANMDRVAALA